MIQYAVAPRFYHRRLWNTGSPAFAGDDTGCVSAFSQRIAPEVCRLFSRPLEIRGRRECRMRAAPAISCANCRKLRTRAYRAAEAIRHSLRNGFTAYNALSPVSRSSLATVAPGKLVSPELDASISGVRTTRLCRTLSQPFAIGTTSVHRTPSHVSWRS